MSSTRHNRKRRASLSRFRLEELEARALLSLTAQPFSENVLDKSTLTFSLAPFVQESDPNATVTYSLTSTTTTDGGKISLDPGSGLVTFTPAASSPSQDSFSYSASDTDSNTTASEVVTLNLASIAANPSPIEEVEGQTTIGLTILNLPGAVQDDASQPSDTFSNLAVVQNGEGTVSLVDASTGRFTYTPPSSTFTGDVTITYQVTDGTSTNNSSVQIAIGPIAADPVAWGTLSSTTSTIPSTTVPSLKDRIHDITTTASYTFTSLVVPSGDGAVSNLNASTGSFTYTAPSATFTGTVPVQYTVSDGTNSTTGTVMILVGPLVTQPVAVSELDHQTSVTLTITDLPSAVQDIASDPTYTFSGLRLAGGGGSVPASGFDNPDDGTFTYDLPGSATPGPVHIDYTVTDGTNTASGVVTIQLAAIVANPAQYSILESTSSTLPALDGRINDVSSSPNLTFSNPTVPSVDGTVQFTNPSQGILSYTPPSLTIDGMVPIQYTVSDGTNTTTGVLDLEVAPLVTSPLLVPVALQTQTNDIASLVTSGNVADVSATPSYTFSNLVVPVGDGTAAFTNTTTGTLTYTPPSPTFFGVVQATYTVTDGDSHSASGSIVINVEQTIQPQPDGSLTAVLGRSLTIDASRLLANDTPAPDGLKPSIASVGDATNGTVVLNTNGTVTFTPTALGAASFQYTDTDASGDASTIATVNLIVKLATTIYWSSPQGITYGTPLSGTQLDAIPSVPGTLIYSPAPGTILHAGSRQVLKVTFTPDDTADYADDSFEVLIDVAQAPTYITWSNPADIVHGTALSGAQLDATATVGGTFTYVPAAGIGPRRRERPDPRRLLHPH